MLLQLSNCFSRNNLSNASLNQHFSFSSIYTIKMAGKKIFLQAWLHYLYFMEDTFLFLLSFLSKFYYEIPKEISCILTHLNSRPLLQASSMLARSSNTYLYPSLKIPLNFPSYIHYILLLFLLLFISLNYLSCLSAVTKNTHFHDNKATKNSTKSN